MRPAYNVQETNQRRIPMSRTIRGAATATLLTLGAALLLGDRPANAQGPYGRNSYEDFPFNQGSLFYRPLKPKAKPKARVVQPRVAPPATAYPPAGYTNVPQYTPTPQPRYYY